MAYRIDIKIFKTDENDGRDDLGGCLFNYQTIEEVREKWPKVWEILSARPVPMQKLFDAEAE